ncbi:hypothetical protein [Deinococcus arenicola]|uniref:Uncharacterized protein n=1 Tax=Deinococcus arenicola TaxID=2994950 RepID=A0ABU4DTL4_9DEIO|nr:hypothetical protein [Deinococcus sp. ZS9-10]MDV6375776.1 hypothetical protein [Deinococcus sp. ZS9-10]
MYVPDLSGFIAEGMDTVFGLIASGGATVIGAPFVVYHGEVNTDNDGLVEVCVPYSGPLTPGGRLILRQEPAHAEAYVTLTKSQFQFPGILDAYDAASAYASAHGSASDLGPREVYPHAWDGLKGDDLAGDMAWPFVPQES